MEITVEYFLLFREYTGRKSENMKVKEGTTVRNVLEMIAAKYGEEFHEALFDRGGNTREYVRVLMDGRDVQGLSGVSTELKPNCTISLFPPASGGS